MSRGQTDLFSEIIVDNFAGGGGASTGIELATGVPVTIAINHDPDAILMHKTNHPFTEHYQASVWDIDPVEVCRGRPVGLAWFSPDCFVAGTLILTKDGYKPIEEIRVGDLVLTHKGRWRPVVETMTSEKPVYKVRGYGNPGLVCSGKHPFYTTAKLEGLTPTFKEAKDLEPGKDYWGIPAEMISPVWDAPEDRINSDLAWLAGRYVGDGWLRMDGGHYETVISCGEQDIESLRAELAELTPSFKWNFRRVRTGGQFTHCGKALCVWLNDNFGRLSDKKTIPAWLYTAPERVRAAGLNAPMQTIDSSNRYALVSANLVEYFGTGRPIDISEPMHTVTSHDREALTAAHIAKFKGQNIGQSADTPLQTITAGGGEFAAVSAVIQKCSPGADVGYWPEIRKLLNKYCGYSLTGDEIILLNIGGTLYYIRDILLRMLSPRELYAAMGFPEDYIIDRDYLGNEYGKTKQVARCGNAVCPPIAEAVVRANYEPAKVKIKTMAELNKLVSA